MAIRIESALENLPGVLLLEYFTLFPEYFLSISILYIIIACVVLTYSSYGLLFQKALSECLSFVLFLTCCLIVNDDLIVLDEVAFQGAIVTDYLAYASKLLICLFSSAYFLMVADFLKDQKLVSFEYLLIIMFSILGFMLTCSSNDLLTAYLSIELASLSSYILASFKKTSSYSVESGLKYFIIGAISSAFFLLGSSFLYAHLGTISFDDITTLFELDMLHDNKTVYALRLVDIPVMKETSDVVFYCVYTFGLDKVALLRPFYPFLYHSFSEVAYSFIIFGLFIKLAAAPFHLWSLDVYEGSPTSSSFFFAVIGKLSIFVLLIRVVYINTHHLHYTTLGRVTTLPLIYGNLQFYTLCVGVISVFVGSFGGLKQKKLKTLLAYSSVTSMGYGLLGLGSMKTVGIQMLFFHLIVYMLSGFCTWSIFFLLRLKTKNPSDKYSKELSDLTLLRKSNPALAFALSLTMFSIAGIPPLIGFLAKFGIFVSLVASKHVFVALISSVLSVVGAFYYIRVVKVVYFENVLVGRLYHPITSSKTLLVSVSVFFQLYLFVNPSLLYIWSYKVIPDSFLYQV